MIADLSRCPFCDGAARWNHNDGTITIDSTAGAHWIDCTVCGASTNLRYSLMEDCRPLLAEQWNRRTASRPVAQVVAIDPPGPDGHGVNWLRGKRPKPGDLLYAAPTALEDADQFEFIDVQNHRLRRELRRLAHELRTYNPAADEYKGAHIHGVWARDIDALLQIPSITEPNSSLGKQG